MIPSQSAPASRLFLRSIVVPGLLLQATTVFAQEADQELAEKPPEGAEATSGEQLSAEKPDVKRAWRDALTRYSLGDGKAALKNLRAVALKCMSLEEESCTDSEMAGLYMSVGIVLSGAESDHGGGVRAFKKALSYKESLSVPDEYQTAQVVSAFNEAKTGRPATTNAAPAAPAPRTGTGLPLVESQISLPEEDHASFFILPMGGFKLGPATRAGDGTVFLQAQAALTFLAAPDAGQIVLGGEVSGGTLVAEGEGEEWIGGTFELGGVFGERRDNAYNFILTGVGFQHLPDLESTLPVTKLRIGRSFGGLALAGSVSGIWGVGADILLFGVELGYGGGF